MGRVIAYVDGYNLYYGLRDKGWKRFYWLNIQAMVKHLLKPGQTLLTTKYFTTIVKRPEDKRKRQAVFLEALQSLNDFRTYALTYIGRNVLSKSVFTDEIVKSDGVVLRRPAMWR